MPLDALPVFWMHIATEIVDVSDVDVGRNAEDGRQVAEPSTYRSVSRSHSQPTDLPDSIASRSRSLATLRSASARLNSVTSKHAPM